MTAPTLEKRFRRLERRNRFGTVLALSALGFLWLTGFHRSEEVVTAERFELIDGEGRVRAEMGIDEDGSAGLFLRDGEGRICASLIHDDAQTALYLMDESGTIRVGAAQYAHGGGGFAVHGDGSKGAAVLYLKERKGSLTFYDEEGGVRARLPE